MVYLNRCSTVGATDTEQAQKTTCITTRRHAHSVQAPTAYQAATRQHLELYKVYKTSVATGTNSSNQVPPEIRSEPGADNTTSASQPHQVYMCMHTDTHSAPWHVMPRADCKASLQKASLQQAWPTVDIHTPDRHTAHHKPDRCAASPSSNIPMSHLTVH
jgi:hypothetical protein